MPFIGFFLDHPPPRTMDEVDMMVPVTAAIMAEDGCVLIAKRKSTGRLAGLWEFPGGKVEPGETASQCLKRELREEFDIDVTVGPCIGTSIYRYPFGTIALTAFIVYRGPGRITLHDHAQIRWMPPDLLHTVVFTPADLPFVRKIVSGEIALAEALDLVVDTPDSIDA